MSAGGKGSSPRPYSVSQSQFNNNWEETFGKKNQSIPMPGTIGSAKLVFPPDVADDTADTSKETK